MKSLFTALLVCTAICRAVSAGETTRIVIVVGPSNHPPGSHEVAAGGRVMQYCLEQMENVVGVKADVFYEWPEQAARDTAAAVVFIGDTFPLNRLPDADQNLADLEVMMRRGCSPQNGQPCSSVFIFLLL